MSVEYAGSAVVFVLWMLIKTRKLIPPNSWLECNERGLILQLKKRELFSVSSTKIIAGESINGAENRLTFFLLIDSVLIRYAFNFSGIEYEELLYTLFGNLSDRRRSLVRLAFNVLDKDGSGLIEPTEIASVYDASKHPDVVNGKRTPEEILSEFLETFEVNGDNDGKVSLQEFENYYSHVSASIDDDDYFELMMRNAWHISGGEGWCANTSNRRVLVTHSDGTQSVEEIKNDLGLKASDDDGMVSRLRAQGVDVSNIEKFGGLDTTKGEKFGPPPRGVRAAPTFTSSFIFG